MNDEFRLSANSCQHLNPGVVLRGHKHLDILCIACVSMVCVWSCSEIERVLHKFTDLDRLDGIFRAPVICKHVKTKVEPETFANLLKRSV